MHVGFPCGQSAHVDRSCFFGTWCFEDTTPMSIADVVLVALRVFREVLGRCGVVCFVSVWQGRGPFFGCLTFWGFGIPPCSIELSPLSCGAVLLERGCV